MKGTNLYVKFRIDYTETVAENATVLSSEGTVFKMATNEEGYTFMWRKEYMKTASTSANWSSWNTGHGTDTSNSTWYIEAVDGEDDTYYLKKTSDASGSIFFGNVDKNTEGTNLYTNQSSGNIKWVLEETTYNDMMVEQGYWPKTSTSGSPKYYTIKNTRASKYAKYAGDAVMMDLKSDRFESTANAFWFEAVSVDGLADDVKAVKIHNAGAGKCVAAPNSFTAAGITWYLKADVDVTHGTSVAINSSSTDWSNTGYAWNNYQGVGNQISTWKATDEGSAWWIEPLSEGDYNVMRNIQPFVSNPGEGYFKISSTNASTLSSAIATKRADGPIPIAGYEELLAQLDINIPATGFYRIKSSGARTAGETYITYGYCSNTGSYGLVTTPAANKYTDAGTVIYFDGSDGAYKLSTQGLNVQDENGYDTPFTATSAEGVTFVFEILSPGVVAIRHNTSDGYAYLHESGWDSPSAVVRWEAGSDASQWTIEDAENIDVNLKQIGSEYFATLCVPFAFTTDANTTAYTVKLSGESLVLSSIDDVVPAGTPVVLIGSEDEATITINGTSYANTPAAVKASTQLLTGVYTKINIAADGNDYFLAKVDGIPGFYQYSGSATTLGANRAYIEGDDLSTSSNGFKLVFADDDDVTAVAPIIGESVKGNAQLYDLQGRKVVSPRKGQIYIQNGKAVLY
ncbi:MAG: hypothetical protein J5678_03765 [Bacteroidaceae bacterium]|nr:hypothetical protein [Bacteroidaceae bacterium]